MRCSKWLHRLRSSRGFPDSDHINLDNFLSSSLHKMDPQTSKDSTLLDKRPYLHKPDDGEPIQGRDVINNVLSELFQMGEFSGIKRKKSCRKQQCPRICVVSTDLDVQNIPVQEDRNASPSPSPSPPPPPPPLPLTPNNRRKVKELNQELQVKERVEEEEKDFWDLSAYSQTEVTVIDTSVPAWKFEKMLYRRKNVWKVGDKKGKGLMSGDRKKRKDIVNENGDVAKKKLKLCSSSSKSADAEEGGLKKKKKKKKKKMMKVCTSSKYVDNEEARVRSKSAQGHEEGRRMAAVYQKKQQNKCRQVQEMSTLKKQTDGVILIKSIPTTNKKDVSGIPKS